VLCLEENRKIIMTGIPGVGKTTLLSKIVEIIKSQGKSVVVMSFGTLMFVSISLAMPGLHSSRWYL